LGERIQTVGRGADAHYWKASFASDELRTLWGKFGGWPGFFWSRFIQIGVVVLLNLTLNPKKLKCSTLPYSDRMFHA
jgi:hypothetical protein